VENLRVLCNIYAKINSALGQVSWAYSGWVVGFIYLSVGSDSTLVGPGSVVWGTAWTGYDWTSSPGRTEMGRNGCCQRNSQMCPTFLCK